MTEIDHSYQQIEDSSPGKFQIIPVFPPVSQREEVERDTQGKTVKSQVQQAIVAIEKSQEPEEPETTINAIQSIEQANWQ